MGQIEVTRRRARRRKKLLDDLKDRRGYCQLKEEALDRTMWRNRFERGFGPVVWQITEDDEYQYARNECEKKTDVINSQEIKEHKEEKGKRKCMMGQGGGKQGRPKQNIKKAKRE